MSIFLLDFGVGLGYLVSEPLSLLFPIRTDLWRQGGEGLIQLQ